MKFCESHNQLGKLCFLMFKVTSKSLSYVFCILLVAFNPFATEKSGIVKLKTGRFLRCEEGVRKEK